MSFTSALKEELVEKDYAGVSKAFLAGVLRSNCCISIKKKKAYIVTETADSALALKTAEIIKTIFSADCEISFSQGEDRLYTLKVAPAFTRVIASECKLIEYCGDVPIIFIGGIEYDTQSDAESAAYIAGLTASGAVVSVPEEGAGYHMEWQTGAFTADLIEMLSRTCGVGSALRIQEKEEGGTVYVKESGAIEKILKYIGAARAVGALKAIKKRRSEMNAANRINNCEMANIDKSVGAATEQIIAIRTINKYLGINNLAGKLREAARLRLEHEEATLQELGEMLNPPVGKSGMNHRFRKLTEIAKGLKTSEDKND